MKFYNTEVVFNVIGDYPVVDQFDVLYSNLMSGSTNDNYITGSLISLGPKLGSVVTYVVGERGLAFSKLGVSIETLPDQSKTDKKRSYNLQPWRERAGNTRLTRIFSDAERYYDSLAYPFFRTVSANSGSSLFYWRDIFSGSIKIDEALDIEFSDGSSGISSGSVGAGYFRRFPFESIFSGLTDINRIERVSQGIKTSNPAKSSILLKILPRLVEGISGSPYIAGAENTSGSNAVPLPLEETDAAKVIFGFGDNNTYGPASGSNEYRGYKDLPAFRSSSYSAAAGASTGLFVGPIIRGWRYGIHDANPHYTSVVFRRDRYGQIRDMLEQRPFVVSYLDAKNSPIKYISSFESPAMPIIDESIFPPDFNRPLSISFVKQLTTAEGKLAYVNVDPNETWSSNVNTFATSSLPYFDGQSRNRGEIPAFVINPALYIT